MKHIGIAAHSAEGGALCFRTICMEGGREIGEHDHPTITMDCEAMARSMPLWDAGDHAAVRRLFGRSIERLHRAGCEFFILPDNTAHLALEVAGEPFALPGLHIAEVVALEAARLKRRCVGILGTRYTMDGPIYPRVLASRGIEAMVPDAEDRARINTIIFDELVRGVITSASRDEFTNIIERLAVRGCDAVALVCTEIPLIVTPESSSLPTLDSTRLLARAALDVALGLAPMPVWRGGPLDGV